MGVAGDATRDKATARSKQWAIENGYKLAVCHKESYRGRKARIPAEAEEIIYLI